MSLLLLPGCKKYPDGPLISFKSAQNRIKGKWYYDHFYEDGKDLVGLITCDTCYGHSIDFTFNSYGDFDFITILYYNGGGKGAGGRLHLVENDKCIEFGAISSSFNVGPLFNRDFEHQRWRIRRLKVNEFWVTCEYKYKHYELNLFK